MTRSTKNQSAYDVALTYLTSKARTVREVEMKLDEGDYSEGEIMQTIERLKYAGLLDDDRYACEFIETRLNTKPISAFRLAEQLKRHYVDAAVIETSLKAITGEAELANAVAVAKKFFRQFATIEDEQTRLNRVISRLQTRGFDFDTIKLAIAECQSCEQDEA